MAEILQRYDEKLEKSGQGIEESIDLRNYYNACAMGIIYNPWIQKFLVQQRTPTKSIGPNLWTYYTGGRQRIGEELNETLYREISEEIGLKINPYELRKYFKYIHNSEHKLHIFFYLIETNAKISELIPQIEEVQNLDYIEPFDLLYDFMFTDKYFKIGDYDHQIIQEVVKIIGEKHGK